jgi:tRNA (guanine37-N1)-methyltransferase
MICASKQMMSHHSVDDTPYGGGAGMVMTAAPWGDAIDAITNDQEQLI